MKVAFTADLHLRTKSECPERYNALEYIIKTIEVQDICNLVIAGDLFDKDFQNYIDFENLCKTYPKMEFHIIPGNHDINISEKSVVSSNIHIYDKTSAVDFDSTTFLFVPYKEKINMGEPIAENECIIKENNWVLIGHGDYYGGVRNPNPLEPGTYMPLSRENVVSFNPQAVFLGHIHKPANWQNVYYTGSPCGLDISEVGIRRFFIYNTQNAQITSEQVKTEVIYFQETFLIVPVEDEHRRLKQEAEDRIFSWGISPEEYSKVIVRIEALGYSLDKSGILSVLTEVFSRFRYYKDESPDISNLSTSLDHQLNAIAESTLKQIDELEWDFEENEPGIDMLKVEALKLIYKVKGK